MVASDAAVFVPEESRLEDLQIYEGFSKAEVRSLEPLTQAHYLELPAPSLDNNLGDVERLEVALGIEEGDLYVPLDMLRHLSKVVRDSGWRVRRWWT